MTGVNPESTAARKPPTGWTISDMAARMNRHRRSNDTNPYAAPETADRSVPAVELPPGSPWTIDGDALLCRGDLTFDWLCFSTGLPVEPDAKVFYMKIFAPSQQRQNPLSPVSFIEHHDHSDAACAGPRYAGWPGENLRCSCFCVCARLHRNLHHRPSRTPSFRIYYRRSREGRRRHLFRRTIPSLAMPACSSWAPP